jgi:hypothetical protein
VNVLDAEAVLREPHAIDEDYCLGFRVGFRGCLDIRARKQRFGFDLGPFRRATEGREFFVTRRILAYERVIEKGRATGRSRGVVTLDEILAHAHHRRGVAAGAKLAILRADAG